MTSKVVRINDEAIAITSQYSADISTAIILMQAKLDELRRNAADLKDVEKLVRRALDDTIDSMSRRF